LIEETVDTMSGFLRFNGAVKRDPAIATWLAAQPGELQSLAMPCDKPD
jgi:hypothetical protein